MNLQMIAYFIALVIAATALIFSAVIMYKIFLKNRSKKEKPVKVTKKEKQQTVQEEQKTAEPEIKLYATETTKITGFELDDDD